MIEHKTDKRSLRTRNLIKKAVMILLKSKRPEEINVSEIAEIALISRNSFYTHYKSVSNVLEDVFFDIATNFNKIISKYDYFDFIENPYPMLQELTMPIIENSAFSEYVVFSKNSNLFVQGLIDALTERFLFVYTERRGNNDPSMPYLINFLVAGAIEFIYKWFKDGKPVPFEMVLNKVSLLIRDGIVMIRSIKKDN